MTGHPGDVRREVKNVRSPGTERGRSAWLHRQDRIRTGQREAASPVSVGLGETRSSEIG